MPYNFSPKTQLHFAQSIAKLNSVILEIKERGDREKIELQASKEMANSLTGIDGVDRTEENKEIDREITSCSRGTELLVQKEKTKLAVDFHKKAREIKIGVDSMELIRASLELAGNDVLVIGNHATQGKTSFGAQCVDGLPVMGGDDGDAFTWMPFLALMNAAEMLSDSDGKGSVGKGYNPSFGSLDGSIPDPHAMGWNQGASNEVKFLGTAPDATFDDAAAAAP